MIEEIKILLGDSAANYNDSLLGLIAKQTIAEVLAYTNREALDYELENVVVRLAVIRVNKLNADGLAAQSYSGVSESYINGYPDDIRAILNRKRKIKVI